MVLAQSNPAIADAWGVVQTLSADERMRALADAREKAYMDYNTNIDGAHREGMEEGIQIGEQKGLQEGRQEGLQEGQQKEKPAVAANALREKIPVETVAKLTGLSVYQVEQIAAGLAD